MAHEQQIADTWGPAIEHLRPAGSVRRDRRIDMVVSDRGDLIYEPTFAAAWDGNSPLMLGTWHLWIDASGRLRVKNGKATNDLDGQVVGVQI